MAKFTVQHTGFPTTRRIEEHEWKEYSQHDTESAAWKAVNKARAHLDRYSWDDHYRVIGPDGRICNQTEFNIEQEVRKENKRFLRIFGK